MSLVPKRRKYENILISVTLIQIMRNSDLRAACLPGKLQPWTSVHCAHPEMGPRYITRTRGSHPVDVSVARQQGGDESALRSDLIDLSGLSLADLRTLDDDDVADSVRRILREVDRLTDAVAGFQSAI